MSENKNRVSKLFEAEEIKANTKSVFTPFRFWQKKSESCAVVFLDTSLEAGHAIREHNIQGSDGKWGNFETCLIDSGENCPICKKYSDKSYLILFLTVLVRRAWVSKTGENHEYSRMLFPLKRGQFQQLKKLEEIAIKKNGTMRGMQVIFERESDDKAVATGVPVPNDDGSLIDNFYTAEQLEERFGHPAMEGKDGTIYKEENEDLQTYKYMELFPEPDINDVRKRLGVETESGSISSFNEELKESNADPHDGEVTEKAVRTRKRSAKVQEPF